MTKASQLTETGNSMSNKSKLVHSFESELSSAHSF